MFGSFHHRGKPCINVYNHLHLLSYIDQNIHCLLRKMYLKNNITFWFLASKILLLVNQTKFSKTISKYLNIKPILKINFLNQYSKKEKYKYDEKNDLKNQTFKAND